MLANDSLKLRFQRGVYPAEDFTAFVFRNYTMLRSVANHMRV